MTRVYSPPRLVERGQSDCDGTSHGRTSDVRSFNFDDILTGNDVTCGGGVTSGMLYSLGQTNVPIPLLGNVYLASGMAIRAPFIRLGDYDVAMGVLTLHV